MPRRKLRVGDQLSQGDLARLTRLENERTAEVLSRPEYFPSTTNEADGEQAKTLVPASHPKAGRKVRRLKGNRLKGALPSI
jgi:hypothetical protein